MGQSFSEIYPPKLKWTVNDIPDLTGKVAIVTGGNTGIGYVTCKYLLLNNAKVYMASRSPDKGQKAVEELKKVTGKQDIYFLRTDLADLVGLKGTVQEFTSKESSLHILFNNAGVMNAPMDDLTKQGYDMQFGTNVLGHAYFTLLLLPVLLATAKTTPDGKVRVVNVSSNGHLGAPKGGVFYETVKDGPVRRKKLSSYSAYFQSKWGNLAFAKELAKRYGDQGIVSTALNPGGIRTELQRNMKNFVGWLIDLLLVNPDPLGATTQLYAGTAPEAANLNGKYLIPWARVGWNRADGDDPKLTERLWDFVEGEIKAYN